MTAKDLIVQQFRLVYDVASANLSGMTEEHSLVQPRPAGNCANWILGHLVNVHNAVMQTIGAEPVWESEQLDRAGWEPIQVPTEAIDWDTMTERFLGSRQPCLDALAALSDAQLDEEMPDPFGGTTTRGGLLGILAFHQTYHVGQLAVSRRLAGLPGAIRGPGQPEAKAPAS